MFLQYALVRQRFLAYNGRSSSDVSTIATEFAPVLNWCRKSGVQEAHSEKLLCSDYDNISVDKLCLEDQDSDNSDDEIEDW